MMPLLVGAVPPPVVTRVQAHYGCDPWMATSTSCAPDSAAGALSARVLFMRHLLVEAAHAYNILKAVTAYKYSSYYLNNLNVLATLRITLNQ